MARPTDCQREERRRRGTETIVRKKGRKRGETDRQTETVRMRNRQRQKQIKQRRTETKKDIGSLFSSTQFASGTFKELRRQEKIR